MIETPHIIHTAAQPYAALHLNVPSAAIQNLMGPGIQEVYAAVAVQNMAPAGPWFTHHFKRPGAFFDFEICVPVASAIAPAGRIQPGVWPSMRVARTTYLGDYSGLPAAWGEFENWIQAQVADQGLMEADDLWERYVINPQSDPNPSAWRTELSRQLLD